MGEREVRWGETRGETVKSKRGETGRVRRVRQGG